MSLIEKIELLVGSLASEFKKKADVDDFASKGTSSIPVYFGSDGRPKPILNYAGNSSSATKALQDSDGNVISETYLKSVNGVTPDSDGNVNLTITDEAAVELGNMINSSLATLIEEEGVTVEATPIESITAQKVEQGISSALVTLISEHKGEANE